MGLGGPGGIHQGQHIGGQMIQGVCLYPCGLVADVVTTLVWGPDVITGLGQGWDLVAPAIPELGKAMQQDHQLACCRT